MDAFYTVVRFFVTGGAFMYPILIVFAVGTAIAVERYMTLAQDPVQERGHVEQAAADTGRGQVRRGSRDRQQRRLDRLAPARHGPRAARRRAAA